MPILLAHHYQRPEVQEVADAVADSLKLSQAAAKTECRRDRFLRRAFHGGNRCDPSARRRSCCCRTCARAARSRLRSPPEELLKWKAKLPDAVVVSYINTSAAVKAESDYCCTSANAAKVVQRDSRRTGTILFLPDKFLAEVVARQTGRSNIVAYPGYCHVHKTIRPEQVVEMLEEHPDIELLLHPECGCVSSCMAKAMDGTLAAGPHFFPFHRRNASPHRRLAREGICRGHGAGHPASAEQEIPDKTFYPVNPNAVCAFMKTITLDKRDSFARNAVAADHRARGHRARSAKRAIDRMLELA